MAIRPMDLVLMACYKLYKDNVIQSIVNNTGNTHITDSPVGLLWDIKTLTLSILLFEHA